MIEAMRYIALGMVAYIVWLFVIYGTSYYWYSGKSEADQKMFERLTKIVANTKKEEHSGKTESK